MTPSLDLVPTSIPTPTNLPSLMITPHVLDVTQQINSKSRGKNLVVPKKISPLPGSKKSSVMIPIITKGQHANQSLFIQGSRIIYSHKTKVSSSKNPYSNMFILDRRRLHDTPVNDSIHHPISPAVITGVNATNGP
ncbi:hypothetical protein V6N13_019940 [Hibiscus sabdariffa]|uniref:Uncharacterized protein n=1 Tax=Hibiscus sabdariffa TaxID=183260 RepID=A0ABR2ERZ8_9ROSI